MSQPPQQNKTTTTRTAKLTARQFALFVAILALVVVTGASLYVFLFRSENLAFRTIAQSPLHWGNLGLPEYTANEPALFVIAKPEEVNDLATKLLTHEPQTVEQLRIMNYDHEFAVLALHGAVGSDGYGVTVQQIQRRDSLITIQASFASPVPGTVNAMIVTSPYHLIAVSKVGTWGAQFRLVLTNGSKPVAETTHFIP